MSNGINQGMVNHEPTPMDLSPAKWIWLPSERTLMNTFILLRKEILITADIKKAAGYIAAESRYLMRVNGTRVQWGPAPYDPRWPDADPFDITSLLNIGKNVIGIEVLFYGEGDGTWSPAKPGLIFKLDLEYIDGSIGQIVSDDGWMAYLDRAHKPGQFKRFFCKVLQEEFDARLHPSGWDTPEYICNSQWTMAMHLDAPADKPASCSSYLDYLYYICIKDTSRFYIRKRQIPHLIETVICAKKLAQSGRVKWLRNPDDWFEFRMPGSFVAVEEPVARELGHNANAWEIQPPRNQDEGVTVIFEFEEEKVGWPYFTIEAPEGAVVEMIWHEAHDPARTLWLDSGFYSWARFTCVNGVNRFETFEYDAVRWLQLHIRNVDRPVIVSNVGIRSRKYNWMNEPRIKCSEPDLQRLFDAAINTVNNGVQDTIMDGVARERNQYSGDVGHVHHIIRYAFGDPGPVKRFLRVYSEGITKEGYFITSYPGSNTSTQHGQRQTDFTVWGPMLDVGMQFVFDHWMHYLEWGELGDMQESYPRLKRFASYIESICQEDGLLPVENLLPVIWMDHIAFREQAKKKDYDQYMTHPWYKK